MKCDDFLDAQNEPELLKCISRTDKYSFREKKSTC